MSLRWTGGGKRMKGVQSAVCLCQLHTGDGDIVFCKPTSLKIKTPHENTDSGSVGWDGAELCFPDEFLEVL